MKPHVWLRITCGLYVFFTLGHSFGFNFAPSRGPEEVAVLSALRTYRFAVQGFTRSHWEFLRGFGHLATVMLVLLAVLTWQLGQLSKTQPQAARPLVLTLLLASIALAILSWAYFFTGPAVTATLAALCLLAAWLRLGRAS